MLFFVPSRFLLEQKICEKGLVAYVLSHGVVVTLNLAQYSTFVLYSNKIPFPPAAPTPREQSSADSLLEESQNLGNESPTEASGSGSPMTGVSVWWSNLNCAEVQNSCLMAAESYQVIKSRCLVRRLLRTWKVIW